METMVRNRKLRLLVTTDCPNKRPLCCNNSWDFSKLPKVRDFDYDEIMITGGEPLLFTDKLVELSVAIRSINPILYPEEEMPKIYVYTSIPGITQFEEILDYVDGVVLTPHSKEDVNRFVALNKYLYHSIKHDVDDGGISLRLNLFKNIKDMLPEGIDLSLWKVKDMEWIKDCSVPQGEDFMRLPELWHESGK